MATRTAIVTRPTVSAAASAVGAAGRSTARSPPSPFGPSRIIKSLCSAYGATTGSAGDGGTPSPALPAASTATVTGRERYLDVSPAPLAGRRRCAAKGVYPAYVSSSPYLFLVHISIVPIVFPSISVLFLPLFRTTLPAHLRSPSFRRSPSRCYFALSIRICVPAPPSLLFSPSLSLSLSRSLLLSAHARSYSVSLPTPLCRSVYRTAHPLRHRDPLHTFTLHLRLCYACAFAPLTFLPTYLYVLYSPARPSALAPPVALDFTIRAFASTYIIFHPRSSMYL
ncbi:hypothetical protein C8R47DRAFT_1326447 [Mycena vitilis]|nr:hypothetical protein C8R47DRAFT_1326447 [Mycena vitilis]